jgi:hypothetical protein
VRDDPEEECEHDTYDKASNDGKVERGVFAAVNDVAGQFSQAEVEFTAKIEESTDKNQKAAEKEEGAAEFAEGIHAVILPEGANKSVAQLHLLLPYTNKYTYYWTWYILIKITSPAFIDPHFKVRMANFAALNSAFCLEV